MVATTLMSTSKYEIKMDSNHFCDKTIETKEIDANYF